MDIKKFIPPFLISWHHFSLAFWGAVFFGFPSRKLIVIGITGTKGKSTVVDFCHRIFQEAGFKVASMSSIRFKINDIEKPNLLKMTMPGRFQIQKFLRQTANRGCKYAILEVTSEGILQHRHRFIKFNTAVFTNLSPEHIERHGSFENYRSAKGKFFQSVKDTHIINLDDENAKYFLQFPAKKKYTYGLDKGDINNRNIELKLELMGDFNIYNALSAICVGLSQAVPLEISKRVLEKIKIMPGRMETIIEKPFKVIADYAHTPDALEKVYQALTNQLINSSTNKLICVLGSAGGGRDRWKRPVLGEIAARYCDEIIITNEDPYDENPLKIIEDIESGFFQIPNPKSQIPNYRKILDRREAIREALKKANPGDILIITGKGCEPWMCTAGGEKIPWDDRQIIREEFQKFQE